MFIISFIGTKESPSLMTCRANVDVVCVLEVVVVFAVSYMELLAGLLCVLPVACDTFKMVYSIFLVFVSFWNVLWL